MKKLLLILLAFLVTLGAFAQEATPTQQKGILNNIVNDPLLPVYAVATFIFIVILLVMSVALYLIKVLNLLTEQAEREKAEKLGIAYTPRPTAWQRAAQRLNASVPVEQEKEIELEHSYDGIKELDNHLPPWWKYIFYGTIGWSAVYVAVYHFSNSLPLSEQEYRNEISLAEEQANKLKASQPQAVIDENTLQFINDPAIIEKGKSVFMSNNCGSCHRNDGGGNTIGPNLTDEYWLHGGEIKNIFSTIKNGVVEKGMPAWGKVMSPQDVRNVAFFVMSLQGTKPENAKAAQGELFKQVTVKADSTKVQASL